MFTLKARSGIDIVDPKMKYPFTLFSFHFVMFCFEIFLKIFDFYEYFTALTSLNYLDKFLRIVHALTSLNSSK